MTEGVGGKKASGTALYMESGIHILPKSAHRNAGKSKRSIKLVLISKLLIFIWN